VLFIDQNTTGRIQCSLQRINTSLVTAGQPTCVRSPVMDSPSRSLWARYVAWSSDKPTTVSSGKMEYTVIRKGRGFVYACQDRLYRQVKKDGNVRYMTCCLVPCDRSAILHNGEFKLGVSLTVKYQLNSTENYRRRCL